MRSAICSTITLVNKYMERGTLEVAPLAYMRGRTLSDAFVILDEAQNATDDQIKMFLTRLGSGSKMVVTGDVTQIDLPGGARSGLRDAATRLASIEDIGVVELGDADVVRHPLVAEIVRAYARGAMRAAVIHYRNDVRRSGVDGRALVATAKRLLRGHRRERRRRSRSLSSATRRCARSIANTAERIARPTC